MPLTTYAFKGIFPVAWDVEFTAEFEAWWVSLDGEEQVSIDASVRLLETYGPTLPFPHSTDVRSSRHGSMRELRVQHRGRPLRVLYAFDPRRTAILLFGGDKSSDPRWYETHVPKADILFDAHLEDLQREGDSDG